MTQTDSPHLTAVGSGQGIAQRLAEALSPFIGGGVLPVRLRAWDGSETGSPDGPLVVLNSVDAVRRLLWHPGELGAAQAYVTGELDVPEVDGWDLSEVVLYNGGGRAAPDAPAAGPRISLACKASAARAAPQPLRLPP